MHDSIFAAPETTMKAPDNHLQIENIYSRRRNWKVAIKWKRFARDSNQLEPLRLHYHVAEVLFSGGLVALVAVASPSGWGDASLGGSATTLCSTTLTKYSPRPAAPSSLLIRDRKNSTSRSILAGQSASYHLIQIQKRRSLPLLSRHRLDLNLPQSFVPLFSIAAKHRVHDRPDRHLG